MINFSGDSYTQTGFDTNGTQPTPTNPLGNPPYPGQNLLVLVYTLPNHSQAIPQPMVKTGSTISPSNTTNPPS